MPSWAFQLLPGWEVDGGKSGIWDLGIWKKMEDELFASRKKVVRKGSRELSWYFNMCVLANTSIDGCLSYGICLYFQGAGSKSWLSRAEFLKFLFTIDLCWGIPDFLVTNKFLSLILRVCVKKVSPVMLKQLQILIYSPKSIFRK